MKLLQTKVPEEVAERFKVAAKARGSTPYAWLAQLVAEKASEPVPQGWELHRAALKGLNQPILERNACLESRKVEDR
jgi:hypothetical protein